MYNMDELIQFLAESRIEDENGNTIALQLAQSE